MVSQSVCQGIEPTLRLVTRYYFLSEGCCLVSVVAATKTNRSMLFGETVAVHCENHTECMGEMQSIRVLQRVVRIG
jgi:hypothetical protein